MIFYPTLLLSALTGASAPAPAAVVARVHVASEVTDDTFESVSQEFDSDYRAWRRMPRNERAASPNPAKEYLPRFQALAEADSVPAMAWIVGQAGALSGAVTDIGAIYQRWMGHIVESHHDDEAAVGAITPLYRNRDIEQDVREELARTWLENGVHESGQTSLPYALGQILFQKGTDEATAEAIELYSELESQFPEDAYAKRAGGEVFKRTRLQVGLEVPDFDAEDVDGVAFSLSDYRGKVVLLDFWGFW